MGQQLSTAILREPIGVLDHKAIHVHDVERAIGSGAGHDGSAPAVFAGEKIALFFSRGATEAVGHAVFDDDVVLHQIMKRLAGEGIHLAFAAWEEEFIAIDHAAARRGEMAGVFK